MPIVFHPEVEQGSDDWKALRCGLLTASEMKLIVTPTLKVADNEKTRIHLYELMAQRVTNFVEETYISDDMLRGHADEVNARIVYDRDYAPTTDCGFITNDEWGFTIGYSPDALVGDDGLIECKSRRQKYQMQTFIENVATGTIPADYLIQCQTGLLVTRREWLDFVSYCGGLPMAVVRVWPDPEVQTAIINAAEAFEEKLQQRLAIFCDVIASDSRFVPTERTIEQEMF